MPPEQINESPKEDFKIQMGSVNKLNLNQVVVLNNQPQVPKLNFQAIEKNSHTDYNDWYRYSLKLEDSIKFMRQRIQNLEQENQ